MDRRHVEILGVAFFRVVRPEATALPVGVGFRGKSRLLPRTLLRLGFGKILIGGPAWPNQSRVSL
jgi:hypothetical protein